jgi:kynurenine 3-monooxygenase
MSGNTRRIVTHNRFQCGFAQRALLLLTIYTCLLYKQACGFETKSRSVRASSRAVAASMPGDDDSQHPLRGLTVTISGAGPSGLVAAHRLASAGAHVDIFERRRQYTKEDRAYALGIGRRGRTAIQSCSDDLWEKVKQQGFGSERFDLHLPGSFLKIRLRDENDGQGLEPSFLLFQSDLCKALADELVRLYPNTVNVQFEQAIANIDFDKMLLTTDKQITSPFDLILGCDGVNSPVREAIDESWEDFKCSKETLPGYFKVVRLDTMPPSTKLDPTAVALLLPKAGTVSSFVEPCVEGCCILFSGNNATDPLLSSSNVTFLDETLKQRWPQLDLTGAAEQLAFKPKSSTASLVKCNTFHYGSKAALLGDACHASGGVSGQGVNSALVDSTVLVDHLLATYDANRKDASIRQALLAYSQQQVPEANALYDLAFGPKPQTFTGRLKLGVKTVLDSVFKGRYGIGNMPLRTQLTTSLETFAAIRRQRDDDYEAKFPDNSYWKQTIAELDAKT